MDLYVALRDAENRLAKAEKRQDDLTRQIHDLRLEKQGLEIAIARHHGSKGARKSSSDDRGWTDLPRTLAIERVLMEEDKPMSPAAISSRLAELGRENDPPHYVSAALSHLKKQKKIRSAGHGLWEFVQLESPSSNGQAGASKGLGPSAAVNGGRLQ